MLQDVRTRASHLLPKLIRSCSQTSLHFARKAPQRCRSDSTSNLHHRSSSSDTLHDLAGGKSHVCCAYVLQVSPFWCSSFSLGRCWIGLQ